MPVEKILQTEKKLKLVLLIVFHMNQSLQNPQDNIYIIYSLFMCQDENENEDENQSFRSFWR